MSFQGLFLDPHIIPHYLNIGFCLIEETKLSPLTLCRFDGHVCVFGITQVRGILEFELENSK